MPLSDIIKAAREYMSPQEAEVFVSHSPCLDGDTAAMCAINNRPGLKMLGYDHTKPFDVSSLVGKKVIFADCAPTPEQYDAIVAQEGGKVLVLDHHAPAMAKLKEKPGCFSVPEESGASLLWEYFNPGKPQPKLITLVRDNDLFKKEFPESDYLVAGLRTKHPRLVPQDLTQYLDPQNLQSIIDLGKPIVEEEKRQVAELASKAVRGRIRFPNTDLTASLDATNSFPATVVEIPGFALASKVGEALYGQFPEDVAVLFHPQKVGDKDAFKWYLRAAAGPINASEIASKFVYDGKPGGGHPKASGAMWAESPLSLFTPASKPWLPSGFTATGAATLAAAAAGATVVAAVVQQVAKQQGPSPAV